MGLLFAIMVVVTFASVAGGLLLAIPANLVARRLGQNPLLFTALALVPFVNLAFFFVVAVWLVLHVLDRLDTIAAALKAR